MQVCSPNSAQRRLSRRIAYTIPFSVFLAFAAAAAIHLWNFKGVAAWSVAVLAALPVLAFIAAVFAYLGEEKDEFQRMLHAQYLLAGTGGLLAAMTIWGYLEDFARAPHLHAIWIYPIYWFFVGISVPVINARYR
jgi:membrane protein YdbS with pleckstrin-like domain